MTVHTQNPQDQHTFLLREGVWEAEGTGYVAADAAEARISGRTEVRHPGPDRITNEGWMKVHTKTVFEIWQRYEFRPGSRPNTWTFVSHNDRVGDMTGEVLFWGPYALIHCASAKGRFRGSETLTRVSDSEYSSVGKFVADGRAETIWAVRLRRVSD